MQANTRTSPVEVIVNGVTLLAIAVLAALLSDKYLTDLIGPTTSHILAIVIVGLTQIKGFTSTGFAALKNQQAADAPDAPPTGRPDDPVNVHETPPPTDPDPPVSYADTVSEANGANVSPT